MNENDQITNQIILTTAGNQDQGHNYQIEQQQLQQQQPKIHLRHHQLHELNEKNVRKRKIDEINNRHQQQQQHHQHEDQHSLINQNNFLNIILPQENAAQSNINLMNNNHNIDVNNMNALANHHNSLHENIVVQQQEQHLQEGIMYTNNIQHSYQHPYHNNNAIQNQNNYEPQANNVPADMIFHAFNNTMMHSSSSSSSSSNINMNNSMNNNNIITSKIKQVSIKDTTTKRRRKRSSTQQATKATNCYKTYDWVTHYNALIHYSMNHNHCNVPLKELYECDIPDVESLNQDGFLHYAGHLGKWLARQRMLRKREGLSRLSDDKEALLQKLVDEGKMEWELVSPVGKPSGGISWELNYAALVQYGREHGHCNVPLRDEYRCEILPSVLASLTSTTHTSSSSSSSVAINLNEEPIIYIGNLGKWLAHNRRNRKNAHGLPPRSISGSNSRRNNNNNNKSSNNSYNTTSSGNSSAGDSDHNNENNINNNGSNNNKMRNSSNSNNNSSGSTNRLNGTPSTSKLRPYREQLLQRLVDEGKLLWSADDLSSSAKSKLQSDLTWPQNYAALLKYYEEYNTCNVPHKSRYECDIEILMEESTTGTNNTNIPDTNINTPAAVITSSGVVGGVGSRSGNSNNNNNNNTSATGSSSSGGVMVTMQYNGQLGNWVHNQRQSYKGNGFPLKPERQALLQQLVNEGKMRW